jgi:hypothetical protein
VASTPIGNNDLLLEGPLSGIDNSEEDCQGSPSGLAPD